MIRGKDSKLEDEIVSCLAMHGVMTAAEIQAEIRRSSGRGTIQAVHQELRKLMRMDIVFKLHRRYALRMSWVIELIDLSQKMFDQLTKPESVAFALPEPNSFREWAFSTLHHSISFYTQLGLVLMRRSESKQIFESAPHVWYHLAHPHAEGKFLSALKRFSVRYFFAVGNDTPLSRSYQRLTGRETTLKLGQFPLRESLRDAYLIVIDDFIATLRVAPRLKEKIERLFQTTGAPENLSYADLSSIFHEKHTIRLRLERSKEKTRVLRSSFRRFFGSSRS